MSRKTQVLTISLPKNLSSAIDELSEQTAQTRSELIRNALREYLFDAEEDRIRFLKAYKATRKEPLKDFDDLIQKYNL